MSDLNRRTIRIMVEQAIEVSLWLGFVGGAMATALCAVAWLYGLVPGAVMWVALLPIASGMPMWIAIARAEAEKETGQ